MAKANIWISDSTYNIVASMMFPPIVRGMCFHPFSESKEILGKLGKRIHYWNPFLLLSLSICNFSTSTQLNTTPLSAIGLAFRWHRVPCSRPAPTPATLLICVRLFLFRILRPLLLRPEPLCEAELLRMSAIDFVFAGDCFSTRSGFQRQCPLAVANQATLQPAGATQARL
ncbi:hypothetical protein BC828DRAFT_5989 [Blastocladiella britannica]|nr:hypothetical protein BC828DRAFT_5989 [Blastocladiella britannica]